MNEGHASALKVHLECRHSTIKVCDPVLLLSLNTHPLVGEVCLNACCKLLHRTIRITAAGSGYNSPGTPVPLHSRGDKGALLLSRPAQTLTICLRQISSAVGNVMYHATGNDR